MKDLVTAIVAVITIVATAPAHLLEAASSLSCDVSTTVVVPLVKADPRWPKEPLRFGCVPKRVEVVVVGVQSRADLTLWTVLNPPLRAVVVEEGSLRLELTGICSGSNGEPGVLEGGLKWGGLGVGLRNCRPEQFQALQLEVHVEK